MSTFLRAEWRNLAMVNYVIDPTLLTGLVPTHTELDLWNGRCYISLVGFMFVNTRVMGIKVPWHVHFEEVNLRFYVRHHDGKEWKRGVVFIREIVPRPALTFIANNLYHEKYETMSMTHTWVQAANELVVEYRWRKSGWNSLKTLSSSVPVPIPVGSEEEFIAEHYWGYTMVSSSKTLEYQVAHPRWLVHPVKDHAIDVDFGDVYGSNFGFLGGQRPASAFLAEGSEITVSRARVLR